MHVSAKVNLIGLCSLFALAAAPGPAAGAGEAAPPETSVAAPASSQKSDLHVSDHVKLSFYERLDVDEDRWRTAGGKSVETPREFHERTELSGDYEIQDDGTISLPLLGRFRAAGQSADTLLTTLKSSFEDLIGRKGFVNLLAIEHRPIYVVGPVKNPGAFPFEPGLTPLHVIALAGGLKQEAIENWQQVEAGREMDQLQKSLERVKRLVTRSSVLKAERDGDKAEGPELVSLVGQSDLKELSADERAQRELVAVSRRAEQTALAAAVENARSELKARENRVTPYDDEAKLLSERVKSIQTLVDRNIIGRPVLIEAQNALSEVQDRRTQAEVEVEAAKDKLAQSEHELLKSQTETKVEIARAVAAAEQDTGDAVAESVGALNVIKTIAATQHDSGDIDAVVYEIVRHGPDGAATYKATDLSTLEPGDLVRIRIKKSHEDPVVAADQ
jgi:polysaccharide biosynthesis/export protein ExoF